MKLLEYSQQTLFSNLKFKGKWRGYQQRVLNELQVHLDDKKLNVVAAPGAGKTTLGIEVMRRLNKPSLILTPTIVIKNQWKQRILEGFCEKNDKGEWISTDINNVSPITISTYQGLHSIFKNKEEKENFINKLAENHIQTLVLDEAHHLRKEWYTSLQELQKILDNPNFTTVALTATPPYDVSQKEWNNYNSLCGSVDAEIAIPELVKNGDLCPHQDLVYFSNLAQEEEQIIFDYEKSRKEFFSYIDRNFDFLYVVEGSSFFQDFDNNIEIIYDDTDFTVSLISYLLSIDEMNINANLLIDFLGLKKENIPKFDYLIAERLINGILNKYEPYFPNFGTIIGKLKELNLLKGKKVCLFKNEDFEKIFTKSINKLNAIEKITEFENSIMKDELREVILLDYIGKDNSYALNIISLFEKLSSQKTKVGILTGTLVVIPNSAKTRLYEILKKNNIDTTKVLCAKFRENYLRAEVFGNVNIVEFITELFSEGLINVLIGTTALLGEGWDSPSINTLIIGSSVGSFMLSNQIRGRALRINKNNLQKCSNIWHLVSLTKNYLENSDFSIIEKRFNTFEGISYYNNIIQNGIERLNIDIAALKECNCDKLNEQSLFFAAQRKKLKDKWFQIFTKSEIVEENMVSYLSNPNSNKSNNLLEYNQQVFDVISYNMVRKNYILKPIPFIYKWVPEYLEKCIISEKQNFLLNFITDRLLKKGILQKEYKNYILNNYNVHNKQKEQEEIARILLKTLCNLNFIRTYEGEIDLKICTDTVKSTYITITNCTNYERNLFIKSFFEIFNIEENARYILKKENKYLGVPEILSTKKESAKAFEDLLMEKFGYFDIIYTRTPIGYKELLNSKFNPLIKISMKKRRIVL